MYLMDIRNYTWVNSFKFDQNNNINTSLPNQPSTTSTTSNPQLGNQPSGNNNGLVIQIVAIVSSVVGVVALIGVFLIYKYKIALMNNRNNQINDVKSDGEHNDSNIEIIDCR